MPSFFTKYGKSVFAFVGAAALTAQAAITDGTITKGEWLEIVVAGLAAVGVYFGPAVTKASRVWAHTPRNDA